MGKTSFSLTYESSHHSLGSRFTNVKNAPTGSQGNDAVLDLAKERRETA